MTAALSARAQIKRDSALLKVDSLKPVIVRPAEIRPHMHGDTMEFNTNSIRMRINASVEELLGRLPGLHIDPDGTITYNGEKIRQLLVDGEDLFGSNPGLVTRNFDASMIARIQVLDRKSDQARFSGIDDGSRIKTLNLVLKEDSRKGYFGKVEAGGNVKGDYSSAGLLASFRNREQATLLASASNIGTSGFSNIAGGSSGGISALNPANDPLSASAGTGIPRLVNTALHYANTWTASSDHIVGNYQYGNLLTRPVTGTRTLQTLPDSQYSQYRLARSVNQQNNHSASGGFDRNINKYSAMQAGFHYSRTVANNEYSDTGLSSFNGIDVNSSQRTIRSTNDLEDWGGIVRWNIRSGKKTGRILSVSVTAGQTDNNTEGYLYSLNRYYQPDGALQLIDTTDQRKEISSHTMSYSGMVNAAEPLDKKNSLDIYYSFSSAANQSLQSTYNRGDGKYKDLVDSLSSHFTGNTISQSGAVTLRHNDSRLSYALIGGLSWYDNKQKDLYGDSLLHFHYFNFNPVATLTYVPNSVTRAEMSYSGAAQQPGPDQLQPVRNNNDPLHITLGNPNLHSAFSHTLHIKYARIKTTIFNLSLDAHITNGDISTRTITDSLGRQISQPLNVNGGRDLELFFSESKKIWGLDAGVLGRVHYSSNANYVNSDLSRNDVFLSGFGFNLGKYVNEKYSFNFSSYITHFNSRSSVNITAPINYWSQAYAAGIAIFLLPGFEINTNLNYTWQQKSSAFAKDTRVALWNASIGRNLLANRLVLKLQANNLLNQNSAISRSNAGNTNTETSTNILGRYWMLLLTWRFDHKYRK